MNNLSLNKQKASNDFFTNEDNIYEILDNDLKELDPLFKLIEPQQMKLISESLQVMVSEKEDLLGEIGSLDFFGKPHREDFCPPFIEPMAKLAGVSTKKNSILEVQVPITL